MHMRTKKWARPELEACGKYTDSPENYAGKWKECFDRPEFPLHIELGCGKGVSTAKMIHDHPDINYLAIDIADNVLGDTHRNILHENNGQEAGNAFIVKYDIEYINKIIKEQDKIERIYIHFCNPWTKRPKHEKRRLTHPRQLLQYRKFLSEKGEIWFKTDDDDLFADSMLYFKVCGFEPVYVTENLHASGFEPNYMSEHEMKFSAQGIPIKAGIFRKKEGDFDFDATRWNKNDAAEL